MGAKKILEELKKPDFLLKIGNEVVVIEVKPSEMTKGTPTKEILKEFKKASKEGLISSQNA